MSRIYKKNYKIDVDPMECKLKNLRDEIDGLIKEGYTHFEFKHQMGYYDALESAWLDIYKETEK